MVDKIWYNMEELIGGSEERVLIETYWNVKASYRFASCKHSSSINRNILECKGRCSAFYETFTQSINRNILECKERIFISSGWSLRWY